MDKKGNGAAGCAVPFPFKNTDYRFKAISPDLIRFAFRNTSEKNSVMTARKNEVKQNDFDDNKLRIIISDHGLVGCDLSDKACRAHAASRCIILHIGEDCGDGS